MAAEQIGARVRSAGITRDITQEQLAEEVDKAVETISNIERGYSYTGLETLEKLGQALEIPIREFFEEYEEARSLSKLSLPKNPSAAGIIAIRCVRV